MVALTFDAGTVLVTWDFREPAFRDEATAFHLSIAWSERGSYGSGPDAHELSADLVYREATRAHAWSALVGEPLKGAVVWGRKLEDPTAWGQPLGDGRHSPQGVTLSFPSGAVHVVLGMGPDWIGDGDEVLVFGHAIPFPPEGFALVPGASIGAGLTTTVAETGTE